MKRILALLLCAVIVTMSFASCNRNKVEDLSGDLTEPVTITVACEKWNEYMMEMLFDYAESIHKNLTIEPIYLSGDPMERESQLQRLRTEIVAGSGPDVFLLNSSEADYWGGIDGRDYYDFEDELSSSLTYLFPSVEKAMQSRVFLPLSDYIEASEKADISGYLSSVLEAGQVDGEQYIVPLFFNFNLFVLDKEQIPATDKLLYTLEEIKATQNQALIDIVMQTQSDWFDNMLGEYADYENFNLSIGEDEFNALLSDINYYPIFSTPAYYTGFNQPYVDIGQLSVLRRNSEDISLVSVANREGGITAEIKFYAAINGSTKKPSAAFKLLEILLSDDMRNGVYGESPTGDRICLLEPFASFDVSMVGCLPADLSGITNSDEREIAESICKNINYVKFTSDLDIRLYELITKNQEAALISDDIATEIEKVYSQLKMMVSE